MPSELYGSGSIYSLSHLLSTPIVPVLSTPIVYSCPAGNGLSYVNGSYVKLNGTGDGVVNGNTTDIAAQVLGIVIKVDGARAVIQTQGSVTLNFDGPTTSGHAFTLSTTIAGYFHDTGGTTSSASTLGVVNQTIAGVGQASAFLGPYLPASGGGGGGSPAGPSGAIQFNNSGVFGGSADLTALVTGQVGLGNNSVPGGSGAVSANFIPGGTSASWLDLESTVTVDNFSSGLIVGTNVLLSADSNNQFFGIAAGAQTDTANSHNANSVYGAFFEFDHYGSATVGTGIGAAGSAYNDNAGHVIAMYAGYFTAVNGSNGTVDSQYGLQAFSVNEGTDGLVTNNYSFAVATDNEGGPITNNFAFWTRAQGGVGTNSYDFWADEQGVFRIKADNTFDSVYQAIPALYNPQFTKYTPGATDFERIVLGQWNGNVAEIGNQAGGTGTLRDLRLIGATIRFAADPRFDSGNATGSGTALLGTNAPSAHLSAPYTWIDVLAADGTLCTMPIWQK